MVGCGIESARQSTMTVVTCCDDDDSETGFVSEFYMWGFRDGVVLLADEVPASQVMERWSAVAPQGASMLGPALSEVFSKMQLVTSKARFHSTDRRTFRPKIMTFVMSDMMVLSDWESPVGDLLKLGQLIVVVTSGAPPASIPPTLEARGVVVIPAPKLTEATVSALLTS